MLIRKNAVYILFTAFCLYGNLSFSQDTSGFKKFLGRFLSNEKDTIKKNSFFPFPVGSVSPETGLEYGAAAVYSFYTNKTDSVTRVSTLNFMGTYTAKKQTSLKLVSDIWLPGNQYHFYNEFRYRNYPYDFYGTGNDTKKEDKDEINEKQVKLVIGADKKIFSNDYIGLQAGFEKYAYHDMGATGIFASGDYYGKYGGKELYFGIQETFDSRNNVTYTTRGGYAQLQFNYVPDFFGGDDYHGTTVNFDGRYFVPVNNKVTLAFNGIYQEIGGSKIPFYLLPELGSENIMRGYYHGRFRDKNLLALQSELRYRFIPRLALVAFGGYGAVFGQQDFAADLLKPNYGLGIRYFYDLSKDLSIRLDYGIGQKLPGEKRISGYYFSMSEAF